MKHTKRIRRLTSRFTRRRKRNKTSFGDVGVGEFGDTASTVAAGRAIAEKQQKDNPRPIGRREKWWVD